MKTIFKDIALQDKFHRDGFVVVDLFNKDEISEMWRQSLKLIYKYSNTLPDRYFPVGQLEDFNLRNSSTQLINRLVVPAIYRLFIQDKVYFHSGTHLIKPRGAHSFLGTHQDSAIVDESKYNAVLFWCPLHQIHFFNGQLYVLKGSHKFGNKYRSTTIPWRFSGCEKLIYKYSEPLKVKPGQVCFFHSALIHHSGYNFLSKYRIAISSFISDIEAPLLNYFMDKHADEKSVEVYEVEKDYYHNNNFNERPVNQRLLDKFSYNPAPVTPEQFMTLLKEYTLI